MYDFAHGQSDSLEGVTHALTDKAKSALSPQVAGALLLQLVAGLAGLPLARCEYLADAIVGALNAVPSTPKAKL